VGGSTAAGELTQPGCCQLKDSGAYGVIPLPLALELPLEAISATLGSVVEVEALLDVLERRLTILGAPIGGHLAPGVEPQGIQDILARAGIAAVPDVVSLYRWHDGTRHALTEPLGPETELVPGLHLLSLSGALKARDLSLEVAEDAGGLAAASGMSVTASDVWDPAWLPVLQELDGSLWALDTGEGGGGVWIVRWEKAPVRAFESLAAMLRRWLERYDRGVYLIGAGGHLVQDHERLVELEGSIPP
jgi:hypothetical protein